MSSRLLTLLLLLVLVTPLLSWTLSSSSSLVTAVDWNCCVQMCLRLLLRRCRGRPVRQPEARTTNSHSHMPQWCDCRIYTGHRAQPWNGVNQHGTTFKVHSTGNSKMHLNERTKKLSCPGQTARRICVNAMAWLT